MKVKKLKDRSGVVFTPLTHKDSVVDSNGVPLKNWIAPIAINGVGAGYSTGTNFVNGTHITPSNTRVETSSGAYFNQVTFSHDDVERVDSSSTSQPSSGENITVIDSVTSDSQGHITGLNVKTVTMPTDVTVSDSESAIFLVGTVETSGVNSLKSSNSLRFEPSSGVLTTPKVESNLVGGSKGSVIFQSDQDVTEMLSIGSVGQVLTVSSEGIPEWTNNSGGFKSQDSWENGTSEGPKAVYTVITGYGTESTVKGASVPSASTSTSGVVTTESQNFSGDKTFEGNVNVDGDLTVKGDVITIEERDVVVSDKVITLAATEEASVTTGSDSGITVATSYNSEATSAGDKYKGPTFIWNKDYGWTTGNTDSSDRTKDINIDGGVLRISNSQVLSSTQYVGNSASSNKVNHSISFESKTFDGSSDITINLNDIGGEPLTVSRGGTGLSTLTENTIMLGNGSEPVNFLVNGSEHQVVSISSEGIPAYQTLTLNHIPDVSFTLCEDTDIADVEDFVI